MAWRLDRSARETVVSCKRQQNYEKQCRKYQNCQCVQAYGVATILLSYHGTVFEACVHDKQEMKLSKSIEERFLATSKNNSFIRQKETNQDRTNLMEK